MPGSMWGVLHRPVDHVAHSWDAERQTSWSTLRTAAPGLSLRAFRSAGASGFLCEFAADG